MIAIYSGIEISGKMIFTQSSHPINTALHIPVLDTVLNMHSRYAGQKCSEFGKGKWVFGMWYRNYYLWLTSYVPRLMLVVETGCAEDIMFPDEPDLSAHNIRTIEKLKIPMNNIMAYDEVVWHVGQLTLVHDEPYRGNQVGENCGKLLVSLPCYHGERFLLAAKGHNFGA